MRISPRELFVARPGHVLLSCDYAQMEMRLLASLSGDAKLREFFRGGRDIHKALQRWLFLVDLPELSTHRRCMRTGSASRWSR